MARAVLLSQLRGRLRSPGMAREIGRPNAPKPAHGLPHGGEHVALASVLHGPVAARGPVGLQADDVAEMGEGLADESL